MTDRSGQCQNRHTRQHMANEPTRGRPPDALGERPPRLIAGSRSPATPRPSPA
jgi:hypothetical protein